MKKSFLSIIFLLTLNNLLLAQEKEFPIVEGYGGIYKINDTVEALNPNNTYKVLIELVSGNKTPEEYSFWVNNIARMMNLHGVQRVSKENLEVKVVVHGPAVYDLLSHGNYFEQFKIAKNPNIPVWEALDEAGAEIIICGQSMISRELEKEELWKKTKVATSALTTITKNVADGYVLIKF